MLLVRLDAIGDALTLLPAVVSLRRHGFRIGAVLRRENADVFSRNAFDRIHLADYPITRDLAAQLAAERYGCALIATEKPEGYRLAYAARIPERIGFENGWGKPLKTLWVRRVCTRTRFRPAGLDPRAPHECEVVFSLARTIVGDPEPVRDANILRAYVLDTEPRFDGRVAFQVTSKWERLGAKLEDVVETAQRVRRRHDVRFLGAGDEAEYVRAFRAAARVEVESFTHVAPWKAAIAAASCIVAPDSGASHVAGMVGTPVVVCFAPQAFALQSKRWSPWAARHRVICMERGWPLVAADALEDAIRDSAPFSYKG